MKRRSSLFALLGLVAACSAPALDPDAAPDGMSADSGADAASERDAASPVIDATSASDATTASDADPAVDGRASCASCASYAMVSTLGRLRANALNEVSGIVASVRHPDVFWVHNDSGDRARIFAVRANGTLVGEYAIEGASAVDWEDIAIAPCAGAGGGSCIVVADVGDNPESRSSVDLYRVEEPATLEATGALAATRFRVRYSSGAMNCEGMIVDRRDGASALLIQKRSPGELRLVRVDLRGAGGEQTGEELGTIPGFGDLVTAADMHPCERAVLVRTYASVFELRAAPDADLGTILRAPRVERAVRAEVQGEAIAYTRDGRGYVTTSEGTNQALSAVLCN